MNCSRSERERREVSYPRVDGNRQVRARCLKLAAYFKHRDATAKSLREAAKPSRELAADHERMAKDASK
jgi:hypothetical protein